MGLLLYFGRLGEVGEYAGRNLADALTCFFQLGRFNHFHGGPVLVLSEVTAILQPSLLYRAGNHD
jgi:hypothetical protein